MAASLLKRRASGEERLEPTFMEKVIAGLSAEKPITKKEACAILNIAYNTTRLDKLVSQYKEKKEQDANRRKAKRGKPVDSSELQYIISEYLEGATIDSISKGVYRGPELIKRTLVENSVPLRKTPHDYFKPELIPDGAIRDSFNLGERVYSARYDSMAIIKAEVPHKDGKVYRIWLEAEEQSQFAYQPAWELASLQHLRELGIAL